MSTRGPESILNEACQLGPNFKIGKTFSRSSETNGRFGMGFGAMVGSREDEGLVTVNKNSKEY